MTLTNVLPHSVLIRKAEVLAQLLVFDQSVPNKAFFNIPVQKIGENYIAIPVDVLPGQVLFNSEWPKPNLKRPLTPHEVTVPATRNVCNETEILLRNHERRPMMTLNQQTSTLRQSLEMPRLNEKQFQSFYNLRSKISRPLRFLN